VQQLSFGVDCDLNRALHTENIFRYQLKELQGETGKFHLDPEQSRMDNNERFTVIAICLNRQRSLERRVSIRSCQEFQPD
jgi:hypothetical protein